MRETTLSTFTDSSIDSPSDSTDSPDTPDDTDTTIPDPVRVTTPGDYPEDMIDDLAGDEPSLSLCVPDGDVSTTFLTIGGKGGMGKPAPLDNANGVAYVASNLIGAPVILSGGGMGQVGGGGLLFGRLEDVEQTEDSVRVILEPMCRPAGRIRRDERSALLGSYQLSVPKTPADSKSACKALNAWERGELDYIDPTVREKARRVSEHVSAFESLTPGDTVSTPEYSTVLTVLSEPYETHVKIPRASLDDSHHSVLAVTVDNPRGGFYQLAISNSSSSSSSTSMPSCYLSRSKSSPPSPNTYFTRDTKFSAADVEIDTGEEHSVTIGPDEEVLNSPLPEKCLRTRLADIDGVGEKTTKALYRDVGTADAHVLAYNLHGDADEYNEADIHRALDGFPSKSKVLKKLISLAKSMGIDNTPSTG